MAFAALHYPMDKDQTQLPHWPDNEELAVASDHFFDQFVTFDVGDAATLGGDVLEDPPSPSILLESLQNELASFATGPSDLPPDSSHTERPVTPTSQPVVIAAQTTSSIQADSNSNSNSIPALPIAPAGDPILNNGSISDSELLHLEGISLQSSPPRRNATAPSTPPLARAPLSPRKHSRFVESVYATMRRAPRRAKPAKQDQYPHIDMSDLSPFLDDPRSGLDSIFDLNYNEFADPTEIIKQEPIDCHGLPATPPMSGRIGFVSGHIDDPFCDDDVLGAPALIHQPKQPGVSTPIDTPVNNGETFFNNHVTAPVNVNMGASFRHPQKAYRSTSSAEWPLEGLLTDLKYNDDPALWSSTPSSAAYVTDNGNGTISSPGWWDAPHPSDMAHADPAHHRHHHRTTNGNAAHNMAMHNQQADLPYEYNADLSGLMIHMPQPRTPQAGVLNLNEHVLAPPTASSSSYHLQRTPSLNRAHAHHFQQAHGSSKVHGHTDRRPRPRAPSSGARHHGSQTSPRKLHHSMSMGYLREESQSPSPMARHRHEHGHGGPHHGGSGSTNHHQERRQHRSSSLTMRKQRSFTRRTGGGESRTPSGASASTAFSAGTPGRRGSSGGGGGEGGGGGGGGFGLNFVNYTPNHGDMLMTGVAPSGSSKTKARREKEALEKSRRISEMALRVAGGDMNPGVLKELEGLKELVGLKKLVGRFSP
ncbi:hypothetical protein GGS24DRAFT_291898 [Hypoxylon argillaceum]|nr:hypothetical protein GGS24DRAFT_291898 [Hypoxylon argillaceum]